MRRIIAAIAVLFSVSLATQACCKYPTAVPASGGLGVYARGGGLVDTPKGWPPKMIYNDCIDGVDEIAKFEKAMGIPANTSYACTFQKARVPSLSASSPAATTAGVSILNDAPTGFNFYCYQFRDLIVVVEFTEKMGRCKHINGLAIYRAETM